MPSSAATSQPAQIHPRWQRTLWVLFIGQLFTAVGFSSIFPFLPLYVKELGSSWGLNIEFLAGMVYSGQALTMMIASPFWGALADRFGRKLMVERAMFGGSVILLMMAFVTSAEQLVFLRVVQGFITGTIAASNAMVASIAPRNRMGYAMGLLQVGLGAGVALGPLIGGALADTYGYSAAFYVTSGLLLFSGILVWWGAEEQFEPPPPSAIKVGLISRWKHVIAASGVPLTYSLRFLSQLGRSIILPIAPLFVESLLANQAWLNTMTGLVVGVASITTTLSAGYLGRLGDRIGHQRIVVISSFFCVLFYLIQSQVTAAWQLLALQALVGIALGGIIPSISAMLARLTDPEEAGAVYGLDNSIDAAGRAIAPLLGATIAILLGLRAVFAATALLFLALGLLALGRKPAASSAAITDLTPPAAP